MMKGKPPLTLQQMAAQASGNGRMACWKCGCMDFKPYRTQDGVVVTFRYQQCRHCGQRYFTEQPPERILRPVEARKKPDGVDSREAVDDEFDGHLV